jgi:5-methylcytosine-specific restriction endonuclease McrA
MKPLSRIEPRLKVANTSTGSPITRREDEGAKDRKRFYDSAIWQRTREAKLRRDPLCQCCAYTHIVTQAKHVDHWISLAQGGHPTADENLVSMCTPCHSMKTMAERNGTDMPKIVPSKLRTLVCA